MSVEGSLVAIGSVVAGFAGAFALHIWLSKGTQSALDSLIKLGINLLWLLASIFTAITILPVFGALMIAFWGMLVLNNWETVDSEWSLRARVSSWSPSWGRR